MVGKMMNVGQICLVLDYVFVLEEKIGDFVGVVIVVVGKMFLDGLKDNDDYILIVNQCYYDCLNLYFDDVCEKGVEVVEINLQDENFSQQLYYKMVLYIVINLIDDMKVMQDEIFGLILLIKFYNDIKDVVVYINDCLCLFGLYYFGDDVGECDMVLNNIIFGGVIVNDVVFYVVQEDLFFGGVGLFGMGVYYGCDGFFEFSYKKVIYIQMGNEIFVMMWLFYGDKFCKQIVG